MNRRRVFSILGAAIHVSGCAGEDDAWTDLIDRERQFGGHVVEVLLDSVGAVAVRKYASIEPTDDASPRQLSAIVDRGFGNTIIVSGTYRPGVFTVHDSLGRRLTVIGREGSGPGEFRQPERVVAYRDSLFVFENGTSRVSVLDSAYQFARAFSQPALAIRALATRDGSFFIHSPPSARVPGSDFILMSHDGTKVSEFADPAPNDERRTRPVAVGTNGTLWVAYGNQYVLQEFNRSGKLVRSLMIRRPWFEPWQQYSGSLQPAVAAISADSLGRIWVLVAKPVEDWKRPPSRMERDGVHEAPTAPNDMAKGYDFYLDIIDPETPRVVASAQLPKSFFQGFVEPGVLYSFRNDDDYQIYTDIWHAADTTARGS